ncbi:MAG: hypothetical protein ACXWFG_10420 [Methylobacter sp.]
MLYTSVNWTLRSVIPAGIAGIHDCTDAGGRAPTVGALGDAGAVAEKPWMAMSKLAVSLATRELPNDEHSHPCALDSGNPCRNDVLL